MFKNIQKIISLYVHTQKYIYSYIKIIKYKNLHLKNIFKNTSVLEIYMDVF